MVDAGLEQGDVDGMFSYHSGDSSPSTAMAHDLGIRLNYFLDGSGAGTSPETLIGTATGVIEAGMCNTVVIFRAMNGYSGQRIGTRGGGSGPPSVTGVDLETAAYGFRSPAQNMQFLFARHMYEYGTTSEQLATVKATHSNHASNNPKALYKNRVEVQDVLESRWVVKPSCHLLDCCVENDAGVAIIVTSAERARDLRQRPAYIMSTAGRTSKPFADMHYQLDPITRDAGYYGSRIAFRNAGVEPEDIDVTGTYDAFTFVPVLQWESYGFAEPGGGGSYATSGVTDLGGARPNNTSGGNLCEGYTNGMNLVIENVRQLRGLADDYCPNWYVGEHTFDYVEGRCRQVQGVELTMNMGWANTPTTSAVILRR